MPSLRQNYNGQHTRQESRSAEIRAQSEILSQQREIGWKAEEGVVRSPGGEIVTKPTQMIDEVRVLVESSKPVEQFEITIDWNNRTVYVTDAKGTTFTLVGRR